MKRKENEMLRDCNFWFSIITAITAIIALSLSWHQARIGNKQHLFDRRLKAYMIVNGVMNLYEKNRKRLKEIDWNEPHFAIDLEFLWLTNNSYMEQQIEVMRHPLEQSYQKEFLKRLEELQLLAQEIQLIFTGKKAIMYAEFVFAYQEILHKMYQYQIIIDKINKENENQPTELNLLQKRFGEEMYRKELSDAMGKLEDKYAIAMDYNVVRKVEKQIRLK